MPSKGIWIETCVNPCVYGYAQIEHAVATASEINRGRFVYTMPPPHDHGEQLDEDGVCVFCHRLYEGE